VSDWRDEAACVGTNPEAFFPSDYRVRERVAPAREVCRRCRVQEQCLDLALSVPQHLDRVGIFAGMIPNERRDLRTDPSLVVDSSAAGTEHLRGGPPDGQRMRRDGTRG
jgi:WhiB family redox-sensing transcriptional regulator